MAAASDAASFPLEGVYGGGGARDAVAEAGGGGGAFLNEGGAAGGGARELEFNEGVRATPPVPKLFWLRDACTSLAGKNLVAQRAATLSGETNTYRLK